MSVDEIRKLNEIITKGNKKPEWGIAVPGGVLPAGIGALTTAFTLAPTAPGRLALTLDMSEYIVGDTVEIFLQSRVVVAFRTVGYINIVNGVIADFIGPSASFYSPALAIPVATVPAVQFDIHMDFLLGARLQVIQTAGAVARTLWWHYNYIMEI